jgi:hypothetical protein
MSPIDTLRSDASHAFPVETDDGDPVMPVGEWHDVDIEVTLDSGCCNHVLDAEDAPGYQVSESAGSRRGQNFIVGNGEKVPNEGQVRLNMEAPMVDGAAMPIQSTFQVAEISRPLMSVSKICDQGYTCVFTKDGAQVLGSDRKPVCEFGRSNGLYVANMKLKPPEPFRRQAP